MLSADQRAAVDVPHGSGPVLVPGAPGHRQIHRPDRSGRPPGRARRGWIPERILILAPGRLAADTLRDRFTARLDRSLSTTPARTWASYAFDLIRRAKAEGILPLPRAPRLLSGPEQDLIIKELLEGHALPGLELPWPDDLDAALQTRGFRQEVRQLFDRIIESGRTAEDLADLGRACGRPDWIAAAALYAEYRDVLDLRMPEAFDPAGIITAARQIFQDAPDFLAAERDRLQLILVDDIQEANPAVFELLADIAAGKDCLVTSLAGHGGPGLPRAPGRISWPSFRGCWRADGQDVLETAAAGTPTAMRLPSPRPGSASPDGSPCAPAGSSPGGSRPGPAPDHHAHRPSSAGDTGARPPEPPAAAGEPSRRTCCRRRSMNCGTWHSGSWKPR